MVGVSTKALTTIVALGVDPTEVGEEYMVKYGVYMVPNKHWYMVLLSCELRVEKVSVEVYIYVPPICEPLEALFALMRPLNGTEPFGPAHMNRRGLSVEKPTDTEQLTCSCDPKGWGMLITLSVALTDTLKA